MRCLITDTVGRAIETVSEYKLLHGEAVSIGLVAQARLGVKLGFITQAECDRVTTLLEKIGFRLQFPIILTGKHWLKKLYTDKKGPRRQASFYFQKVSVR